MKEYIKSVLLNRKFYGIRSSEDVFWIAFGFCLACNKAGKQSGMQTHLAFAEFIKKEYAQLVLVSSMAFGWVDEDVTGLAFAMPFQSPTRSCL